MNHFGPPILLSVLALAACARKAPDVTPEQATASYFSALVAEDCAGIQATSGGELGAKIAKEGCPAAFEEAKSHGLAFVSATGTRPDGREPSARLVDITLRIGGKDKKVVGRVERVGDAWKLVTL